MSLSTLSFDNRYAQLPEAFYARVAPTPFARPHLVTVNPDAAALLGLTPEACQSAEFVDYFCGARSFAGADPIAMLYAGHQFGSWVPQLGDGRAILLGEVDRPDGSHWDVQLKGAGRTPFSRQGDGRAVLRSVIREYLCSEAMHGLGIPTTRAMCIIGSDEGVPRERMETGAMMTRLAPSHVRFGTFQVFASRNQTDHLKTLADHVIQFHYPHLRDEPQPYVALLREVTLRTARLVARWQGVGFVHGVLNSDNMSILGLTIDYGPFVFIDTYEPAYVRNHTDHSGFYAFNRQMEIGHFNIYHLATAMVPLMDAEQAQGVLNEYKSAMEAAYSQQMRAKLGLTTEQDGDAALVEGVLDLMHRGKADFTRFFRSLSTVSAVADKADALPAECQQWLAPEALPPAKVWFQRYHQRLQMEPLDDAGRQAAMNRVNPLYILRTHLAQAAIDKAEAGEFGEIERLRVLLSNPFEEQKSMATYSLPPAAGAADAMLSCSS